MLIFNKNKIVFFLEKENPYFQEVLKFKELWESGTEYFAINTSGSTGQPKEILLSRQQLIASAQLTGKTFGLQAGDVAFCCLNISYIAGMMMLVRGFVLGLKMIVVEPKSNYQLSIINHQLINLGLSFTKIKFFAFVPLQMQAILEENYSFIDSLLEAVIIIGGAATNKAILEKIQNISTPVYATYGMTETVTHIAIKQLNGGKVSDDFQLLEGVEIRIDNRNCLKIKSEITNNQWVITNDVVRIIDEKHFNLLGRIDNIINSGGVKIQLEKVEMKVERILDKVQIVNRFFAFGVGDEKLGQKLVLVIESKLNELLKIELFKEKMPKFECPKEIFFVEKFIETPTGKIDKIQTINELILNQIPNR